MAADSAAIAARKSLKRWPRSFISLAVRGNSQSRSTPLNPKVRETVMVELMKVARAVELAAMTAKTVALAAAPPMEMRVVTLGLRVVVKVSRVVALEFGTSSW